MTELTIEQIQNTKLLFLAGGGPDSYSVVGINKCFNKIRKRTVLDHMLDVPRELKIKNIMIIGPEKEIKKNIKDRHKMTVIPEQGKMLENIVYFLENVKFKKEEPLFVVFGDTPLWNSKSFLSAAGQMDFEKADFYTTAVPREFIDLFDKYFKRNFIHLKEGLCRVGCVQGIKPYKFDLKPIQDMRASRKMEQVEYIINSLKTSLRYLGIRGLLLVGNMYFTKALYDVGAKKNSLFFRKFNSIERVEKNIKRLLKTDARVIMHHYAEDSLDNDYKDDLAVFKAHYKELKNIVKKEHMINYLLENNKEIVNLVANSTDYGSVVNKGISKKEVFREVFKYLKQDYVKFKKIVDMYSLKNRNNSS